MLLGRWLNVRLMNILVFVVKPLPEPVFLPDSVGHLVDGNALGLRQEEDGKEEHDDDPGAEEEEDVGAHVAEHCEEGLRDEEGEEHVGAHGEEVASVAGVLREDLARDQPPQRAPRPRESRHVHAHQNQRHHRKLHRH